MQISVCTAIFIGLFLFTGSQEIFKPTVRYIVIDEKRLENLTSRITKLEEAVQNNFTKSLNHQNEILHEIVAYNGKSEVKWEQQTALLNETVQRLNLTQQKIEDVSKQVEAEKNSNIQQISMLKEILEIIKLNNKPKFPTSCLEATSPNKGSGIYNIRVESFSSTIFSVPCNNDWEGGGWLTFQRRKDGSVDFDRNWADYKKGFGDINGEFFLGLDKLYAITNETPQELLIILKDKENQIYYAKYDEFAVGDESQSYALNVLGRYSGNATDSLSYHKSSKFSTIGISNDCAKTYKSGWWFNDCYRSNLNGVYKGIVVNNLNAGISWTGLKGKNDTLTYSEMLLRPRGGN